MITTNLKQIFNTYWNNLRLRVRILQDIPIISEKGDAISTLTKNSEILMEFWKIKIYLEENKVELVHPKLLDISDLDRIFWKEKNNSELQKLDDTFYLLTNYFVEQILKQENKQALGDFEKGIKVKNLIENILERRTYKILKILNLKEANTFTNNLTFEETALFRNIFRSFDDWKQNICSFSSD